MKYILNEREIETIKVALMEMMRLTKKDEGLECFEEYYKYKEALRAIIIGERYNKDIENK